MSKFRCFVVAAFMWGGSLGILLPLGHLIFETTSHKAAYHVKMVGDVTWMSVSQYRSDRRQG